MLPRGANVAKSAPPAAVDSLLRRTVNWNIVIPKITAGSIQAAREDTAWQARNQGRRGRGQFDIPQCAAAGLVPGANAGAAGRYLDAVGQGLQKLGAPPDRRADARQQAKQLKGKAHELREAFFRRHAAEMYDKMTSGCTVPLRVVDLVYKAADLYPGLLPTRAEIDAERALKQAGRKGRQGDRPGPVRRPCSCRRALRPASRARHAQAQARGARAADRIPAHGHGRSRLGDRRAQGQRSAWSHSPIPKFLNAEDDAAVDALETAVDLVLLDDAIEVGVLRGGVLRSPEVRNRRVFNAGINLTHLYYGQISFVEFILERELGLLNKIYRGHWMSESLRRAVRGLRREAVAGGGGVLRHRRRLPAPVRHGPRDRRARLLLQPAGQQGRLHPRLRQPAPAPPRRHSHVARQGIFFERRSSPTRRGHDDLRRDRALRGDGSGASSAMRTRWCAPGFTSTVEQPQGAARRAGALRTSTAAIWQPTRASSACASTIRS